MKICSENLWATFRLTVQPSQQKKKKRKEGRKKNIAGKVRSKKRVEKLSSRVFGRQNTGAARVLNYEA